MTNQYSELVKIHTVENFDIQQITGDIQVQLKDQLFFCFCENYSRDGPFFPHILIHVSFSLMPTRIQLVKDITLESVFHPITPRHGNFTGKIIDLLPIISTGYSPTEKKFYVRENKDYIGAIVDCGFFITVSIPLKDNPYIGEYIAAEGRLDIKLARERKIVTINKIPVNCIIDDYSFTYPVIGLNKYSIVDAINNESDNHIIPFESNNAHGGYILTLSEYGLVKSKENAKKIDTLDGNFSRICGQIHEFVPPSHDSRNFYRHFKTEESRWQYLVLDCGIPLITEVNNSFPFVPGDFVEAIGEILIRTTQ